MNILLIDDCRDLECYAGEDDYGVVARNYDEGIEQLKSGINWNVLYLDYDLSGMFGMNKSESGIQIINFLWENIEFLPKEIIIVSTHSKRELMIKMCEALMLFRKRSED